MLNQRVPLRAFCFYTFTNLFEVERGSGIIITFKMEL